MLQNIYYKFVEAPILVRIFGMAIFSIFIFGTAIHYIEPQTFPSIFEGIWWAVVTASTVGFGDYTPETFAGRLVGIGLIFAGAGFLAAYYINLAAAAVTSQNALREGKSEYTHNNHLVIVGWNERSKEIIDQIKKSPVARHIVLIDYTLEENPYPEKVVHFIKGSPFKDDTMRKARLPHAKFALITADPNMNEGQADMNSILTLVAMKGCNPDLYCVVEILTKDQVINAERAGADEVIETNRYASSVMLNSIYFEEVSDTLIHLLDPLNGGHLKALELEPKWIGLSFQQLSSILLKDRILLIGIQRGEEIHINPPLDFHIESSDTLLVIQP
ncbi:voltage-gated potassium channel [Bacillus ectoiniformans]|uniref:potassium channel family protein n=1 Tax=Bacillus ectoiniformans TaxID=1494429 RepID=UPI001EF7D082|nr:potassium channel family protein [Bacillus ectoiniformans]MBM7648473.1 voltage-gated potassium channel [Bacillus ectoiniformans]